MNTIAIQVLNRHNLYESDKFRYMMLDRMQCDCLYFLGFGDRNKKCLWVNNVNEHIKVMVALWMSFTWDKKPQWITLEDINNYRRQML